MPETGASSSQPLDIRKEPARARVLLPLAIDAAYDYRAPAQLWIAPGDFVAVPLGNRERIGCVWDGEPSDSTIASSRLKDIKRRLEALPLTAP